LARDKIAGSDSIYKTQSFVIGSDNGPLPVTVNWKKGIKYARMKITSDGLAVSAPRSFSRAELNNFLAENKAWINKHWNKLKQEELEVLSHPADVMIYQGRSCRFILAPAEIKHRADQRLICENGNLILKIKPEESAFWREILENSLRREAQAKIRQRLDEFNNVLRLSFHSMVIRDQKTRWGSCSAQGNLSFNWRLILMPPPVLDYVVVHELCHLLHADHSRSFWAQVGMVMPDYAIHRKWLKMQGIHVSKVFERVKPGRDGEIFED
jgi:predicted metal-dependent hydrolase